jgi:hypothetical protein
MGKLKVLRVHRSFQVNEFALNGADIPLDIFDPLLQATVTILTTPRQQWLQSFGKTLIEKT